MATRDMLSVGIDVGTTTSQLVLSDLVVSNQARLGLVPKLDIDSRTVRYQSEPYLTPLTRPEEIDVDRLVSLIRSEYAKAGVDPSQVETGAVIITGETARTRNAEAILHALGDLAGDFVVTVAGPNLESQIAARGSGAAEWSSKHFASVVNIDIGGGSANAALFRSGKHISSSASMVGGRQAVLEKGTGKLLHLAPSGRAIATEYGLDLEVGRVPSIAALRALTDAMADITVDLVLGITTPLGEKVSLSPRLDVDGPVTAYFISGGVGKLYYDNVPADTLAEISAWGDVGPLFARSLHENPRWQQLRVEQPGQTLRATVLGAASQQVSISGSTIWAEPTHLPIRNAPVIEARVAEVNPGFDDAARILQSMNDAVARWDRDDEDAGDFVISVDVPRQIDYSQMTQIAKGAGDFAMSHIRHGRPFIMVIESDYAQVLGQTIKQQHPDLPLIVVDQVQLGEGDFIDIGDPLFDGRVVPVSVKTLVFYQEAD